VKITLAGDRELLAKLGKLKKTQARKAIRKGSRAGSKVIQAQARENAPVKSGALKKEVKVRALKRSRKWTGTQVTTKVEGGPTYYGGFVEFGTKKMKGRFFIRRAVEQVQQQAGQTFIDGIASEIDKL
jgi:HK97 gp10 family phage protein